MCISFVTKLKNWVVLSSRIAPDDILSVFKNIIMKCCVADEQ